MIDIHSHILYNIDDGSSTLNESILMAQEAYKTGFTDIICTPHYNKLHIANFSKEQALNTLDTLQKNLTKLNCPIKLHIGNEIYLDDTFNTSLSNNAFFSLSDSQYILIELSMNFEYNSILDEMIFSILNAGKIPILAHPERYLYIQENKNKIYKYIDMGLLLQSNIGSILSLYGNHAKKTLKFLLKEHLISFIASDAHSASNIYSNFEIAKKKLLKKISEDYFNNLTYTNPIKIIQKEKM